MKNSYLIAGIIIVVFLVGLLLRNRKIEAPIEEDNDNVGSTVLLDGSYRLDTSYSTLSWKGEYLAGSSEEGTVMFSSGETLLSGGIIKSGEFVIDMDTIESIPHKDTLVKHLKSDDFFGVSKYPTSKFVLKSMAPSSEEGLKVGRYVLGGDLTVRGITKPISFLATITQDGNNIVAKASFAINRADWEIKYNSPTFFKNLGDKIIRDAVVIGLDLKGEKVIQ